MSELHQKLANVHPKLQRGLVYCKTCERIQKVDSAYCLERGWPRCCGYTMTIDLPSKSPLPQINESQ